MFRHILAMAIAACSSSAFANTLSDDLAIFEPMLGSWDCIGLNAASPEAPAFEFQSGFRIEEALSGQFVRVTYSEVESSILMHARNNVEYWQKVDDGYRSTFFNVFGQRGELVSSGLHDGQLVWAGMIDTPNGALPFEGRMDISEPVSLVVEPTLMLPGGSEHAIARLECSRGG